MNLSDVPDDVRKRRDSEGRTMSEAQDFRIWAARVVRQANAEPDANEVRRLIGIAEYWVRLAEFEEWQAKRPVNKTSH